MLPEKKLMAENVLEPGQKIDVEWRGKVVWLLNRTQPMLATLPKLDARLADPKSQQPQQPDSCRNEHRSLKPQLLVVVGICSHLGCIVQWVPRSQHLACPCHRASFDLEGNVREGPPPRPLTAYAVAVHNDRVVVRRRTSA